MKICLFPRIFLGILILYGKITCLNDQVLYQDS